MTQDHIRPLGVPVDPDDDAPLELCPTCEGNGSKFIRAPTWNEWSGGSPAEYAECPTCYGIGRVTEAEADEARANNLLPED